MSVNKYLPHVLVLPEDDSTRQIADGFLLDPTVIIRNIQILQEAGGWLVLLERFQSDHIAGMHKYPTRFMILLIDLDGKLDRIGDVARQIPAELAARVFILSTLTEPEDLRASAGSYEEIGKAMARDCREQADNIWKHQLLRHNSEELVRSRESIRPFLFQLMPI
jgi:hypothetical protein